jgi:hypothetical protein
VALTIDFPTTQRFFDVTTKAFGNVSAGPTAENANFVVFFGINQKIIQATKRKSDLAHTSDRLKKNMPERNIYLTIANVYFDFIYV